MNKKSISRLNSFYFAFKGLSAAFKSEKNMLLHIAALLLAVSMGILFEVSLNEWLSIAIVSGMVISAELFNTSIEALTDLSEPHYNEKAGNVKDLSAAAVLIAALTACVTGLIVFVPKIYSVFVD